MKKQLLFVILLLVVAGGAHAQQDSTRNVKAWSLRECVDVALANNLTVKRSMYNVEAIRIDYEVAKYALLPTLNASISSPYSWGRSLNQLNYQYTTEGNYSLQPGANFGVTLFNGLRLQNQIKQTSRNYDASEQDLSKSKNDVILNVITLYVNVILNRELFENAKVKLASSESQLDRTKKQVAAGSLARSEELNLEAQVASNELAVIQNENAVNLAILQLKQAMQVPASTELDVIIPEIAVEDLVLDQTREEVYNMAYQTMPEVRSAKLKVESSAFAVKAAKGSLYPRLTLGGSVGSLYSSVSDGPHFVYDGGTAVETTAIGYVDGTNQIVYRDQLVQTGTLEQEYGYRDQLKDFYSRSMSLSLQIPIFNGLTARKNVQRAAINYSIAEINALEVSNTLRQNVETAFNNATAASKAYNSSVKQVNAREEAFRMVTTRFDNGAANYVEYRLAENDLFSAKSDLARAKYDFIFRKKLLDFYQGKPLGL